MKKKLLVIGHGRHGKDTVCEILRDYHGYNFISSSEYACPRAVFPFFKGVAYLTPAECFEDRHRHRLQWFNLISAYNRPNRARIAQEMLLEGYDIYCGMRSVEELDVAAQLFDEVWWVDAAERRELEPTDSMELEFDPDTMRYIDNNGDMRKLWRNIDYAITQ